MSKATRARPARAEDYEHFVRLVSELGVDDPIPSAERWAVALMPDTIMLERGGVVCAYVYAQTLESIGYVRHLVVAPEARRRGLGRLAMETIAARLRDAGCREWCLNVLHDNRTAIALYRRCGMEIAYRTTVLRLPWDEVDRLPLLEDGDDVASIEPGEDAELEAAFELPGGLLARLRRLEDQVLLRVRSGEKPVAVARFNPEYPGCFPFRAQTLGAARALLEGVRVFAPPEVDWIQLVIENDTTLADALVELDAEIKHQIVHMRGEVPSASRFPNI